MQPPQKYSRLSSLVKKVGLLFLILVLGAIGGRLLFFKGPVLPPASLPATPIIDMHIHIAGLGHGGSGCFISDELKKGYKFAYYLSAFGVSEQEIKRKGDQYLIEKVAKTVASSRHVQGAIVLAMDGVIDKHGKLDRTRTQFYIPNEFLAQQTQKHPSLYFGASINPYRPDALQRLEKVKAQGAKLIKWIPNIQLIDPADKRLIPFYRKMKALNLPLLSHAGQERSFATANDLYGDPRRLELPLSLGVTVIAAHMATTGKTEGEDNYQRSLELFERYPNLYSDISSLTQINKLGYLEKSLTEPAIKGRLLYGSDYPLTNMILVSAYNFPLQLSLSQMLKIQRIENPWDRDIALKQALGVPTEIFARSAHFFDIGQTPRSLPNE